MLCSQEQELSCFSMLNTIHKAGRPDSLDGMTYRPNSQNENNVQENNSVLRSRILILIHGKVVLVEQQSTMRASC